jgi:hypothetical protein
MDKPLERKKPNTAAAVKALDVLDKRIASGEISDRHESWGVPALDLCADDATLTGRAGGVDDRTE